MEKIQFQVVVVLNIRKESGDEYINKGTYYTYAPNATKAAFNIAHRKGFCGYDDYDADVSYNYYATVTSMDTIHKQKNIQDEIMYKQHLIEDEICDEEFIDAMKSTISDLEYLLIEYQNDKEYIRC